MNKKPRQLKKIPGLDTEDDEFFPGVDNPAELFSSSKWDKYASYNLVVSNMRLVDIMGNCQILLERIDRKLGKKEG